jgi:hypothetical protein
LEPIFSKNKISSSGNKNEEIIKLLNKKHKLDTNLQILLEKARKNSNTDKFSQNIKINNVTKILIKKK